VDSAQGHPNFPIQNLPFGVFRRRSGGPARVGVAIGEQILDLSAVTDFPAAAGKAAQACQAGALNQLMALGPEYWSALRQAVSVLLSVESPAYRSDRRLGERILAPMTECELLLPADIGDYTDFYASVHHATNVGSMFRPDNPLLPNYKWLPIGYHGRSSSIVPSSTPVRRPRGQLKDPAADAPEFASSRALDYEMEMGCFIGLGNPLGEAVPLKQAEHHLFGLCLVNDWSARDIQTWEYQPLGPFLGKSFATSISAWVTPLAALEGCRVAGATQEPAPLPHLARAEPWGLDLDLFVDMWPGPADPTTVSTTSFADIYWQFPQQIAHLTSNGASLRTGDLLASGTVSGPERGSEGSLLELTGGGREPLRLTGAGRAVERTFLQASDGIRLRGSATVAPGVTLTLGEVTGRIVGG
jgi:fumarylacetoacetase